MRTSPPDGWYPWVMTRFRTAAVRYLAPLAVVGYAVMWIGYLRHWSWLHGMDWTLLNAARGAAHRHPAWVGAWQFVSVWLGPPLWRLVALVAAVAALVRRNVRAALVLLACGPLNGLVTTAAKGLVDRPRPATMLVAAPSTSFPSGHALETTAALLALVSFLLPLLNRALGRVTVAVATAVGLAVGVSRVALNVHYPSDVLAGWALGYLWFLLCCGIFRPSGARGWAGGPVNRCADGHLVTTR
nr:phosphatase PAP2 family protein [Mycobacterium sp. E1319]